MLNRDQARFILAAAAFIGIAHAITWSVTFSDGVRLGWKFASIGLLMCYAVIHARNLDGWLLVLILLFSAASDLLLQIAGQTAGGLSFVVADVIAITLYARNRRENINLLTVSVALFFVLLCAALAYALPHDREQAIGIGFFVLPLAAMVAAAWMSRFPRPIVAIGAAMILLSDMIIFAKLGLFEGMPWIEEVIWLVYFAGEWLVTLGVVRSLKGAPRTQY